MNRAVRGTLIGLGVVIALAAGAAYPVVARGEAWTHAEWLHPWSSRSSSGR